MITQSFQNSFFVKISDPFVIFFLGKNVLFNGVFTYITDYSIVIFSRKADLHTLAQIFMPKALALWITINGEKF